MSADFVEPGKIDLGKVISGTFQVLGRNLASFTILGLVLSGIPTLIVVLLQAPIMRQQMADLEAGSLSFDSGYWAALAMRMLVGLISSAILQGALIYATVHDMNGQKASVGASLATGLRSFAPLLGVGILFSLAVGFGAILIVPGLMLAVAWCVAAPALVADRTTVLGAFERAAELTRGNRWSIFALIVLFAVATLIVSMVLASVVGVPPGPAGASQVRMLDAMLSPVGLAVTVIERTLSAIVGAAGISVLYIELRKARDGLGPRWLAEIFH